MRSFRLLEHMATQGGVEPCTIASCQCSYPSEYATLYRPNELVTTPHSCFAAHDRCRNDGRFAQPTLFYPPLSV